MANKRLMKEIYDQFLVCKICLETYKQPKTLSCLHIFCTECLEKHVDADYERTYRYLLYDRNIICPICRKKTDLPTGGVRRLPDSFLIANLTEILNRRRMSAQMPSCQICRSRTQTLRQTATAKCLECNKFLCEDCVCLHRRTRVTRAHSLIEVGGEKDIECKIHQDEMVRFYCEPCEQCVCVVCMFQEHKGHEVSSFRDSIERHQNSLDDLLDTCKDRLYLLKEHLNLIAKCESVIRNSESNIRDSTIETIASIRQREREMVQDLHDIYGQDTMEFIKKKETLEDMFNSMSSTCNVTEVIVRNKGLELLLLKREIKDKLELMLQQTVLNTPVNADLQVYYVPGTVVFGHLNVNGGMGMGVADGDCRPNRLMITDTDAGCSASGPCCHVPQWNTRTTDAASAAMTNSFTMTIEPEMYESQTMTDSVDVVKKKVQTEPVEVRDAGVETLRVYSNTVYTNTPETLRCDRSTHTKQPSFTDKLTDTTGLLKYVDRDTEMTSVVMSCAYTETEEVIKTNKCTETEAHETAEKRIGTVTTPVFEQFTNTPPVIMLDMETQVKYYGEDKNVGTRAIVTEHLAVGDHNAFTTDQSCDTGDDLMAAYWKDFVDGSSFKSPHLTDRACSPIMFENVPERADEMLYEFSGAENVSEKPELLTTAVGASGSDEALTQPEASECHEMEIQTDWSIDTDLIMPPTFSKVPRWEDYGVPKEPELCISIEHQHLVHCSCGPDGPMSLREPPDMSKYKLIAATTDTAMSTESQETKNAYTDMGVEAEMEDIMYAIMSGWDRRSSSGSRRSSVVTKTCVDRSTNTPRQTVISRETNTKPTVSETRGTCTPQVNTQSKTTLTTQVRTVDSCTGSSIHSMDKATDMTQPVCLSTSTSTPKTVTSNKEVGTAVETKDWSSMTAVQMCDIETSVDMTDRGMAPITSSISPYRHMTDSMTRKPVLYTHDSSTMTCIETSDVAVLKRPHTVSRSVCTPKVIKIERQTSIDVPFRRDTGSNTNPVIIVDPADLRNRGISPIKFPVHDRSVMVVPETSSKEVSVSPFTEDKGIGTKRVMYTNTGIGTHRTSFSDKETCTPQIHRMHRNTSTDNQSTADKHTATTDISAAYRDLIAQEEAKVTLTRGTCTEPVPRKVMVDKGSSPLKLVRTRDKGTMVNKASFVESDEKFLKAGSMTNRLSDSLEGDLHFVPSLESITESLKEHSSDEDDSNGARTPPITHKERLWNVTPNGNAKFSRDSMFSVNAGVHSTLIKCCVETGTSTQNIHMEDKAISTESFVVDGKMAECISKLRTVRQRLENQPSSSGRTVSTLTSVAPSPIYSRASIMSSQPVTLPSTATADAASHVQTSAAITTVTTSYKHSRLVGDRIVSPPIPIPAPSSPNLSGRDSPTLRSKARKCKLNMTQMLSNSPSEDDSPPTPPTSKSKMRGPMFGRHNERKGHSAIHKEPVPSAPPSCSSPDPEELRKMVSSPERLRERLMAVPLLLQPFRTGKSDRLSRSMDKPRPALGNFDVKLGRGIIPVGSEKRSRDSTPPPPLQRGESKLQRLMTPGAAPADRRRLRDTCRPQKLGVVTDVEIDNLKESDV